MNPVGGVTGVQYIRRSVDGISGAKGWKMVVLMLVLGLAVLTVGAELLVRGSSRLAIAMGISPLALRGLNLSYFEGDPTNSQPFEPESTGLR